VAAEELARPGVEVIQEFRTVTPSVITPTLVPNVVGVCRQIVEVLEDDGAGGTQLNPDALIQMPAFFISTAATGTPLRYTGLDGLSLVVSVNESPDISIIFADPTAFGLTPATVVDQINKALRAALVTSVVAETVGDDSWQLRTVGTGEFQSILIASSTSAAVATTFGIGIGKTYRGLTSYNQYEVTVPPTSLPDPRGNLDELAIEKDSIRSFFSTGSGTNLQESERTEAFLSNGAVAVKATTTEGITDLNGSFPTFAGEVLWVKVDGGEVQVVAIPASVTDIAGLQTLLNGTSGLEGAVMLTPVAPNYGLVLEHETGGESHTIEILEADTNSANSLLGISIETVKGVSIEAVDDGNGDAVTPLLQFSGEDFTAAPGSAVLTGASAPLLSGITAGMTLVLSDGQQPQTIEFSATPTTIDGAAPSLKTEIEAVMGISAGGRLVVSDSGGNVRFTNSWLGDGSFIEILGGTAVPFLDSGANPFATPESPVAIVETAAEATEGTVALATVQAAAAGETVSITPDGGGATAVDVGTAGVDHTDVPTFLAYLQGQLATVTFGQGTTGLTIVSNTTGETSSLVLAEGTGALALLGLTAESVTGTVTPNFGTETFVVTITEGGTTYQGTVTFANDTDFATLKANIEGTAVITGHVTVSQGPSGGIIFTGAGTGNTNTIEFTEGTGGAALLGLTTGVTYAGNGENIVAGATAHGAPFKPLPGDELWIDGSYYATITKVAPGGLVDTLRIDSQKPINENVGQYWYIIAQNLVQGDAANGVTRPYPNMQVDLEGNVLLQSNQLRDIQGEPVPGKAPLYLSYNAIRQDVSPLAAQPGLLRFSSTTEVETALSPISTDNPLALGLFYALINAPGIQVTGLGVDEATEDAPDGTVEGFTRAAEYLEGFEVYAIAPMTHDQTVAQVFNTHVNFMSEPASKGERIVLWNPTVPTHQLDTLVASGTDGDGLTTLTFDTKVVNLSALLQNAGVNPVGTIPVSEGVFLDIAGDDNRYSVESISGGVVTLRIVFQAGTNEDGFYSTTALSLPIISTAFAIRVRGAALVTSTGQQDKNAVAQTVSGLGQSFQNRRFWMTFPDKAGATISGLEQVIEGYYLNAGIVGMIGQQPPQQSFTNFPMTGYTRVIGSNDTFSESQLNQMAAGGAYIIVQDVAGGPLTARMALTTDMTSIETRTDSITKVVDFTAKFMRRGLRNFIGRFNITQGFLDTLGSVIQGLGGFLVETGVLIGLTLNSIVQDEDARDTVLVDTTLDPPYPCNYIRLTLVI
jgi:hypothetical protein